MTNNNSKGNPHLTRWASNMTSWRTIVKCTVEIGVLVLGIVLAIRW